MKTVLPTISLFIFVALTLFAGATYFSCKPDKCANVTCVNGGTCSGGNCVCPTGYEDSRCGTVSRNKFIGNWQVTTASITEPAKFAISVAAGSTTITSVVINNLHNFFTVPVNANISGDSITIPAQLLQGHIVSGGGYIYNTSAYGVNGTVSVSYSVTDTATKVTDIENETWGG